MKIRKVSLIDAVLIIYILCAIVTDEGSVSMQCARLLLVAMFGCVFVKKPIIEKNMFVCWLFLFWLFSVLSITWAQNQTIASAMSKTLFINAICMYAIVYLINFKTIHLECALKACVFAPLLLEIRVIVAAGPMAFLNTRVAGGVSGNTIGLCAAFGTGMALYFILQQKSRMLYSMMLILNFFIVVLSSSRKALLCVFIPIVFVYVFNHKDNFLKNFYKICIAGLALIIVYFSVLHIPVLYSTVGHRIEEMVAMILGDTSAADASSMTRFRLIAWGMEWFREKPWTGHGMDNYRMVLHQYHPDYPLSYYAHNNYVELLVDGGIIGLILYYWNYVAVFIREIKYRKNIEKNDMVFIGMLLALMINEYGLVSYYDKYIQILFALIWVVIEMLKRKASEDVRFGGK